eukprot:TRINITY_DN12664_c3_g1_i28.p1 TRINITY_DN12664_c3_g1~~TRINITY_DN12664_c3_g1_i28.p1  ORF type:complete len:141 (+),score=21.46 TRINITY_DN12664_c3_g1_i28:234-656(+)
MSSNSVPWSSSVMIAFSGRRYHFACESGHLAVAEMLIGKGADMMAKNVDNRTPLHWACEDGSLAVAEMVIGKGADVEAKNWAGQTPLDLCEPDGVRRQLEQAAASVSDEFVSIYTLRANVWMLVYGCRSSGISRRVLDQL